MDLRGALACRRSIRCFAGVVIAVATCGVAVRPALAQSGHYVDFATDYSPVAIGAADQTWRTARLSAGLFDEGHAGWSVGVERQQRERLVDWGGSVRGFRRQGDWTISGGVGLGADPSFSYRRSLEGEVARTVVGTLVAHGGYRLLTFQTATVHLIQPGATLYRSRGEIGARYFVVRNATRNTTTGTLLVQGTVTAHARLRLGGGAAFGERIFDVAALSTPNASAWVGFGYAHVLVTPEWSVDAGLGRAHEDPLFAQRTFTLSIRRMFGGRP